MIRCAKKEDLNAILAIYNDAIINTTAVYTYEPQTIDERIAWFETKQRNHEPIFVFEENGSVLGFATFGSFRPWPAYQYTIEHSIYVDASARGKGIASQLLQHLIVEAKAKGYRTLVAGIDASNEASIKLHQKFNFKHAGTLTNVGYKFDYWLDLAFYELDLKD
ncbi:TPA: N-acetyltransferase [Staphylococcus aureus]|uniref:Phosphinothricin N-acetyltransferase n=6 Tax=Staphylococcaceae TaxID=90964 RepID=A0A2S6DFK1_STAAU|nr:GNAT family N-acetyltransferase [Staphylococcus aureus]MBE5665708.1 N-acetyltransferase family protein [Staphylococcus singaporensis]UMT80534.1 GNAT family N-acetyltransferase [Staphylococcus roterodami]HDH6212157.1 N-acetyltransferase [Staphylococcus aureus LTCF-12-55]HDH6226597.1 N-acetyltransferase [Staphylococcus aureus LTCF-12-46]HDH6265675.1 N-acetyltransferase [Staphylococcus aureus LTCF-7-30]HDH6421775.1 N-acetyltransferase [Staphylococcus aureus MRSA-Lux-33]HDH6423368.1 N-acetylt